MSWKRKIAVDIDTERKEEIIVSTPPDQDSNPIDDMAALCEGICTLIHIAHSQGIKKDYISLKDCINHLEKGFADASYKTYVKDNE